jgi:Tol biopolymer transport system component
VLSTASAAVSGNASNGSSASAGSVVIFSRYTRVDNSPVDDLVALYRVNADGSGLRRLTVPDVDGPVAGRLSPDRSHVAYERESSGDWAIRRLGPGATQQLFAENRCLGSPTWGPSGTRLAFTRNNDSVSGVAIMGVAGKGFRPVPHTGMAHADSNLDWSHDGRLIVFDSWANSTFWLRIVRLDGSGMRRVTSGADPRFSPDDRTLLFSGVGTDAAGLWTIGADGRNRALLLQLADQDTLFDAVWSPDGTAVLYAEGGGLQVFNLASKSTSPLPLPANFCSGGRYFCADLDWR